MKIGIVIILTFFLVLSSLAQEKKFTLRGYISPVLCRSVIQHMIIKDGQTTLTNLNKTGSLFFGGGLELLKKLNRNWLIGANVGLIPKGYFATKDSLFSNGSLTGYGYKRINLNFLETTLFIEKQILLKNPSYKIMLSSGLFFGLHIPTLISFGLEAQGNDFGSSVSAGIQRNYFYAKLDFKQGLIIIDNNVNSSFKTNVLILKIGFSL